jgi:flagellar basal-body rod modification protein FlgD
MKMSTVSPTLLSNMNGTSATTSSSGSGSTSSADSVDSAQSSFMKLLVTQMQYQDPLNPMDNAQVTSQLAQLSTVTGINNLNTTVQALNTSFQASQTLQAASMIGQGVVVPGNSMTLSTASNGTTGAAFGVSLPQSVTNLTVTIQNSSGATVKTISEGAAGAGINSLTWDGTTDSGATAPNGQYTFKVSATSNGQTVTPTALTYGSVASVSTGASGVTLNVPNLGNVALSSVLQIF